jgi:RNA polymerase sigma factor (sigma-70 family)
VHLTNGEFRLKNWESLWGLLVVITLRKCRRQSRLYRGSKRDVHKEVAGPEPGASSEVGAVLVGREPTPHEAAVLAETVDELLQGLDERDRQILRLRLQGHTAIEIGYRVGFTQFTVEGVLKKIRKKLKKQQDLE